MAKCKAVSLVRSRPLTQKNQIPPDLVVKSQAVDIVDIIFRSFYEQLCNRVLGCNGKSRAKLPSLFRRPSVTTKSFMQAGPAPPPMK
jgi:hypothetical protein